MPVHTTPFCELTSERLLLRQPLAEDAEQFFALRTDASVNQYLDRKPPLSVAEVQFFLQRIIADVRANKSFYWAINMKPEPILIGTICLWNFSEDGKKAEVGYELLPAFQGKGVMHEALSLVLDFAFENLRLQIVEGWTVAPNIPSIKTLEKHFFERDRDAEQQLEPLPNEPEFIIYSLPVTRFTSLRMRQYGK